MHERRDKRLYRKIVFIGLLLIAFATVGYKDCFAVLFDPERALLLSVKEAVSMKSNDPRTIFIDVRSEPDFESKRIPSSINIPLHFIRTKKYLKSMTLILVNQGYDPAPLFSTGLKLKEKGFQVFILAGGIAAWYQKGEKLQGKPFGESELSLVSGKELLKLRQGSFLKSFVNIARAPIEASFPSFSHIPIQSPKSAEKLTEAITEQGLDDKTGLLIFNQSGDYSQSQFLLKDKAPTLFFLKGGFTDFIKHSKQLQASLQPRHQRIKTIGGCSTCPQAAESKD